MAERVSRRAELVRSSGLVVSEALDLKEHGDHSRGHNKERQTTSYEVGARTRCGRCSDEGEYRQNKREDEHDDKGARHSV